ncbi:MAG TPA: 4-hydroxy-tetrahydrodipicolinate reductase [Geminicoccaceae bacterium]|nr:4-hydroxy-tetrahydrodipicolinate reductase [Geminicoccaceae bacterium]
MRIGVLGCGGRMGRAVLREVIRAEGCAPAGGATRPGGAAVGRDLGLLAGLDPIGIAAGDDPAALVEAADVVVDFSAPGAAPGHARIAAGRGRAYVVGVTGFDSGQMAALREAAARAPVVFAPNTSLGVSLLLGLVERAARALGPEDFDIEVVEMHHRHKVDAPSGTALALGHAAARGRGVALDGVAARGRDGHTGPRPAGAIGFAALRGGDVVGDHTVMFAGGGERLELTHRATDRGIYARGAVRAALWAGAPGRAPGFYGMADVLGLGQNGGS